MNSSCYRFILDIQSVQSQISIPVSLYDTARTLYISFADGGKPYELSDGCRAVFSATKADGHHLLNDCVILGGRTVRYDFTPQTTSAVGKVDCEVQLYGEDGRLITSPRFTLVVYEGALEGQVLSEDEELTFSNIIAAEQLRVAAENERIASDEEREAIAERALAAAERVEGSVKGDRVYIRYSAYPDGRDYTTEWADGLNYIGVSVGLYEPADESGYEWCLLAPGIYVGSGDMPPYAKVQIDPDSKEKGYIEDYIDERLGEGYTLPENLGSRTLKVLIATPKNKDGSFDEQFRYPSDYGEASNDPDKIALRGEPFDKEYFAKPLVGGEGDGDVGIIMHSNRDKKLEEGLISEAEYDRYADHDEPYLLYDHAPEKYRYTIATRDTNGQLTVEPGTKPFHTPTMQQLRDSLYHDRLTDLFELDADGFGKNVFASTSNVTCPSTLYKDFDATDSPVYPMPIAHWYPDMNVNGSFYYMCYDIPSSLQEAEFDIGFWLYDNDFHYPIENVYDDYHSFRIKLADSTHDHSAHSDSGNIVYLEPRQTFKIGDRAHATVDANIGKWHHITIHCKAGTDSCKYLFVGTNIMNPPERIAERDYDYSTGLHMSMPVMVEGALKWYVRYRNAHYGVLKTGTPVVDGDAANKGYVDALVGDVEGDLNAYLSARAGVLDVFELDDDGFAKWYTPSVSDGSGNLIFTVTKESSDKDCPFYPRPMARFTAHRSFTGENRVSVFSIGSYPGNPWFSVGFWLYDNLSEKNQFRLALGYNNAQYANVTFPARSSLSVGDIVTSSVFDFQYIVDAKVGNWYHIKLPCIAPDRFFCISIGSYTSSAGEYLKFSMPVVVEEQDMHWAVEYPNKYVPLPIRAGAPIEENDAANKAYVDGLVGDVEEALEGIINIQNSLIGGETV